MSRRSLILCLSALAVLVAGLGTAIALLYSDSDGLGDGTHEVSYDGHRSCITAVPSDAVLVACFKGAFSACTGVLSEFAFPSSLADGMKRGALSSLKRASMAVSLHYAGTLQPLYVLNVEKLAQENVAVLDTLAGKNGMFFSTAGSFMVFSSSETLVKSAVRHWEKNVSVADAPGFEDAVSSVGGDNLLFVSNLQARKLASAFFTRSLSRHSSFYEHFSDWMAFEISGGCPAPLALQGRMLYEGDSDEFMSVLDGCSPAASDVAKVLPSYTFSFVTLPLRGFDEYSSAYQSFIDSRQGLQSFKSRQRELGAAAGVMPEDFFLSLDVKEVASASFVVKSKLERINLIRVGKKDAVLAIEGNKWPYPSFAASVYGKFFSIPDESHFTFADGWLVTGSEAAIEDYKSALEYTLDEYAADAGKNGLFTDTPSLAMAYVSLTEDKDALGEYAADGMRKFLTSLSGDSGFAPVIMSVSEDKAGISVSVRADALTLKKTKAPSQDRDTVVTVPSGPFKVKNSGTGKMNTFYQNASKAVCLRDENGKDLWGVPLGKDICGSAHNVDYYANGKLQIIFGAGSSIYVIDRLGRYVTGFPLDLGKEITVGPDVYDFSGSRKYNIIVLHKDNTIQMYNLKGKKPDAWKGISVADETIKALPERLTLGGKDFWVVRTSIQTLIFPFYGGDPLTVFEGDAKIRPDSQVKAVDGTSVEVVSYDGRTRTVKLK